MFDTRPGQRRLAALTAAALLPIAAAQAEPTNEELLQRIDELSQKVLVLERRLEIQDDTAKTAKESTPVVKASPKGFSFQSADGQPARIIILLIIPRKAVQKHIRTLAGVAKLLQYEEMRDALTNARSPREALKVIQEEEQKDPA